MFDRSGDLLNLTAFEMPDILNFRQPPPQHPSHTPSDDRRPVPPLLSISSFLMLPKPKVAFFLCILLLCSICVVFFFFLLNLKGTALCIVYKLNEDEMIILYKHSREQSAQPHRAGLPTAQTWASTDGPGGRLEKSRGPTHCPSPLSLPSKALVLSLSLLSFLEAGWLCRWNSPP